MRFKFPNAIPNPTRQNAVISSTHFLKIPTLSQRTLLSFPALGANLSYLKLIINPEVIALSCSDFSWREFREVSVGISITILSLRESLLRIDTKKGLKKT